jgi:hypothetical protein
LAVFACLGAVVVCAAAAQEEEDEFQVLFDGSNLDAWMNAAGDKPGAGWVIEDGALVRKQRAGDIWTRERFGDFVLELEYKTTGNSGLFFRTDSPKHCVQSGIEMQIHRPSAKPNKHSVGAFYDLRPPDKDVSGKDEWNKVRLTAKDNLLTAEINGEKVNAMDLNKWTERNKNPDGSKNKFRTALKDFKREGHIGFQDHGAVVAYRNVRIKRL